MLQRTLFVVFFLVIIACKKEQISDKMVMASCGQCQFSMQGNGCDLAIRMDGKDYYVEGTNIDDHGDAHASDGFCKAIKRAKVSGAVVDEKFIATSFKIVIE